MRQLIALACAIGVVETLLYSALTPLLPALKSDFALSKGQTGVLVAMYAVGLSLAAIPFGIVASRVGVKQSAISGLFLLAATSIAFGFATTYPELLLTRFLQGAAGALCWASGIAWLVDAAPRHRRGEMIGFFAGASAGGAILGPVVGGAAALIGRAGAFSGVAGLVVVLAIIGTRLPPPSASDAQSLSALGRAHGSRELLLGQWLVLLPGMLVGAIGVLAPLRLHHLGWSPVAIAIAYLSAAAIAMLVQPLVGRWADSRGRPRVVCFVLAGCIVATLAMPTLENRWSLLILVVLTISVYDLLWAPAMALLSQAYDEAGVSQALGFALMNLTAGAGLIVGSAGGGEIAHLATDAVVYVLTASTCAGTLAIVVIWQRSKFRPSVGV